VSRGEGELLTVPKPRAVSLLSVYLTVKPVGEPDALIGHVRFDERGWETERCRKAQATAPILDSTFFRLGAISNLSPLCEQKRTSARATEIEPWLRSLPACQIIVDVVGDLLAVPRQLKQVCFDDRIVRLLGKFPIRGRLAP
jgi:hypothetical protein